SSVKSREDCSECDVQRREEVVGLVETVEEIENGARPADRWRPRYAHAQRDQQKTCARDQDRERDPACERLQLGTAPAEKGRTDIKQVDRHVGHNEKGDEGDIALPSIIPGPNV